MLGCREQRRKSGDVITDIKSTKLWTETQEMTIRFLFPTDNIDLF